MEECPLVWRLETARRGEILRLRSASLRMTPRLYSLPYIVILSKAEGRVEGSQKNFLERNH